MLCALGAVFLCVDQRELAMPAVLLFDRPSGLPEGC